MQLVTNDGLESALSTFCWTQLGQLLQVEFSILDSVPDERLGAPTLTVLVGGQHEDFASGYKNENI
jgi:hypothetical protein